MPRERLPATEADDEFYHADLIGLAVVDADGNALGSVAAVHNFGAGDLIEVKPAQGNTTVLLPFTEAAVPVVDIAGRRIVVDAAAFAAAAVPSEPTRDELACPLARLSTAHSRASGNRASFAPGSPLSRGRAD